MIVLVEFRHALRHLPVAVFQDLARIGQRRTQAWHGAIGAGQQRLDAVQRLQGAHLLPARLLHRAAKRAQPVRLDHRFTGHGQQAVEAIRVDAQRPLLAIRGIGGSGGSGLWLRRTQGGRRDDGRRGREVGSCGCRCGLGGRGSRARFGHDRGWRRRGHRRGVVEWRAHACDIGVDLGLAVALRPVDVTAGRMANALQQVGALQQRVDVRRCQPQSAALRGLEAILHDMRHPHAAIESHDARGALERMRGAHAGLEVNGGHRVALQR